MPPVPPVQPEDFHLRPVQVPGAPSALPVTVRGLVIGRDASCDLRLSEADFPQVSGRHARVVLTDDGPVVEDLGSRNGVFVGGQKVLRHRLSEGDMIRLGETGPQFALVVSADLGSTLPEIHAADFGHGAADLGDSTIRNLKAAMGVQDRQAVDAAVARGSRRAVSLTLVVMLGLAVAAWFYAWSAVQRGEREAQALRGVVGQLRLRLEETSGALEDRRSAWEDERGRLEHERGALQKQIAAIETRGAEATGELARLRAELETANGKLDRYDPVNLEQTRLEDVAKVRRAVVLVETRIHLRDEATRLRLYVAKDAYGRPAPNLDGEGELYAKDGTGSGFCVSPDGHILTNGHVVQPPGTEKPIRGPDGMTFRAEPVVNVVFSGESRRHPAKVVRWFNEVEEDVALLKIEPFDDMPYVADFTVEGVSPGEGTEVFLFGFPLGKLVMQEGDRVIASTFKGILSRKVDAFLQVDAAVHPGNSGGPVTDSAGRVLGIVSRVQATPDGPLANDIGYVLPIAVAGKVWPPR